MRTERKVAIHGTFDIIIWSITVDSDFDRDQLSVRSIFSRSYIATLEGEAEAVPPGNFDSFPGFMWLLGVFGDTAKASVANTPERRSFYDGRYKVRGDHAAEIRDIIDSAMKRFVGKYPFTV